jgi:hypothetical protein
VAVEPTGSGLVFAIDLHDRLVQLKQVESGAWAVARQWQLPVGRNDGGGRLAVAPDGSRVYMSDPDRMRVAIIEANRNSVTFFGRQEGEPGSFGGPSGVATAIDGKVYVVDVASANVQVFVPEDK